MARFNDREYRAQSEFTPLDAVIEGVKESAAQGGCGFLGVAELKAEIPIYCELHDWEFSTSSKGLSLLVAPLNAGNQALYGFKPRDASRVSFKIITRYAGEEA